MRKNYFIKIGILLIFIGLIIVSYKQVSSYISLYNEDIKRSNEILVSINNDYSSFNEVVPKYKENVVVVSKSLNVYYDEFLIKNTTILKSIETVNNDLESILFEAERMSNNCKYDLNNEMMKQKCNNFVINYKSMVDVYSAMIKQYNGVVMQYNSYATKNGKQNIMVYESDLEDKLYDIYNNM